MSRLTASLVVDLVDKTGAKTQAIIGNMDRLKRAERDYMLADRGVRLSNRDRALERMMMEQDRFAEERVNRMNMLATRIGAGVAAAGYVGVQLYKEFATAERRINRILVNSDRGISDVQPVMRKLQQIANDAALSIDDVTGGLERLVATGMSLDQALAFLPAIAMTAQASGSTMDDVANSAAAMSSSMKIAGRDMQLAFDYLAKGGKLGQFEMKEMSQYLPELLPAFAALGYKGTEGLAKLVAMLQTVRIQTGTSATAANNLSNMFGKMTSPEVRAKFKALGIDIRGVLNQADKEGKDRIDTFLDAVTVATRGDLDKLGDVFGDKQALDAVRALIQLRNERRRFEQDLRNSAGTVRKDRDQILQDSETKLQRLANLSLKLAQQVGNGVATIVNSPLEHITDRIDGISAEMAALGKLSAEERITHRTRFDAAYKKAHPDANMVERNNAYQDALVRFGRGESESWEDELKGIGRNAVLESYINKRNAQSTGRQNASRDLGRSTSRIPFPSARPDPATIGNEKRTGDFPSRGTYAPTPDKALEGFMDFHGLVEAGNNASEKIAEGGNKAADTMKASAGQIGQAIGAAAADSILSRLRGSLGALLTNPGGGRPTGQVVKEQANGQFVDP